MGLATRRLATILGRANVAAGPLVSWADARSGRSGWSKVGIYVVAGGASIASGNPAVGYGVAVGLFGAEVAGVLNHA